jgi:hypothetical protein
VRFSAPTTMRGGSDRASMQRRAKARPTALVTQPAMDGWFLTVNLIAEHAMPLQRSCFASMP